MNICYLVNEFPPSIGGWQNHAYNLSREMGKEHHVTVIAPDYPNIRDSIDFSGINVKRFKRTNMRSFLANSRKAVKQHLKTEDVDILHALMVYPVGYVASWYPIPTVVTAHGNDLFESSFVGKKMITRALNRAGRVICVSSGIKDLLPNEIKEKSVVIPNGVHAHEFRTDKEVCRQELGVDCSVVLSVCRLVKRKGLDDLIRISPQIINELDQIRFVIIGDGPEREHLVSLASQLGISDHFHFLGKVEDHLLKSHLCAADVLAMPSKRIGEGDIEGFGIVFLEANASGTPVVGTNTGGIADAIEDGRSGFIVENHNELAERIISLLKDPTGARKMGEFGRKRVINKFSWEQVASRTISVYQEVVKKGK